MNAEALLKDIGLTEKETAVYMALLELGPAAALRIAGKSGIKRPTAYITLVSLGEKGLVDVIPKGTTTLYQAVDPEIVYESFQKKVNALGTALPELRSLIHAAPGKPRVRLYEGKKNILGLYEKEIAGGGDILAVVSIEKLRAMLSREELMSVIHLMKASATTVRDMLEDSPEARDYLEEKNRLALGESKFLSADMRFEVDMLIFGTTVAMISPKTLIAVVIDDAAISSAQRHLLENMWRTF